MRRKRGLTLIEILVVIAIFSILATTLFAVFRSGIDSWRKAEKHLDIYQNGRIALEQMSREISSAILDQSSPTQTKWTKFLGKDTGAGIKTNSAKDEIFFVAPIENLGNMDLCEIGYWLRSTDNALMRHFQKFDAPPISYDFTTQDSDDKLATNVTDLQFTYYYRGTAGTPPPDPTNTAASWNSTTNTLTNYDTKGNSKIPDGLPEAVGITIQVTSSDESKTFSTLVTISNAR